MVTAIDSTAGTEVRVRLINAGLIVCSSMGALIALMVILKAIGTNSDVVKEIEATEATSASGTALIQALGAHLQNLITAATGLYGAFTTFLGTALGAYFGIAAASSANKGVTNALQSAQTQANSAQSQLNTQFTAALQASQPAPDAAASAATKGGKVGPSTDGEHTEVPSPFIPIHEPSGQPTERAGLGRDVLAPA